MPSWKMIFQVFADFSEFREDGGIVRPLIMSSPVGSKAWNWIDWKLILIRWKSPLYREQSSSDPCRCWSPGVKESPLRAFDL
jgi:hypothetical protein